MTSVILRLWRALQTEKLASEAMDGHRYVDAIGLFTQIISEVRFDDTRIDALTLRALHSRSYCLDKCGETKAALDDLSLCLRGPLHTDTIRIINLQKKVLAKKDTGARGQLRDFLDHPVLSEAFAGEKEEPEVQEATDDPKHLAGYDDVDDAPMNSTDQPVLDIPNLGTVKILETIGQGAFGDVHRSAMVNWANDEMTVPPEFALKCIGWDDEEEDLEPLREEIKLQMECDSEYILKCYGLYECEDNVAYAVMDLCQSGSVCDIQKCFQARLAYKQRGKDTLRTFGVDAPAQLFKSPFTFKDIALVLRTVLVALQYMHSKKCAHRDLKCANILVNKMGNVKIGDFGVACRVDNTGVKGDMCGSAHWMAPEVAASKPTGPFYDPFKADIWSVGVCAIELACGQVPHQDIPSMKFTYKLKDLPAPTLFPHAEGKKWPSGLVDFVTVCCDLDPKKRPTCDELLLHPLLKQQEKMTGANLQHVVAKFRKGLARWRRTTLRSYSQVRAETFENQRDMAESGRPNAGAGEI